MGLPAIKADHLFVAIPLAERLRAQVADVPVDVCETAEQVLAADQRQRVLMVLWAGDLFGDSAGAGRSQLLKQRWLVVLGLNNVAARPDARNTLAGPLMSQVHAAVAGWTPAGAALPFKRTTSPARPDISKTKAIYPLCFEIELAL